MDQSLDSPEAIAKSFSSLRPTSNGEARRGQLEQFSVFVRAAVSELLGAERAARPVAFSDWSPRQQALLREIATTPYELHLNAGNLGRMLAAAGAINLGPGQDERYLRRYVGLCEPSPLEVTFDGRPLWLWLRLHLMGEVSRADWRRSAAGLDAEARLALARLALGNAYQLMRRYPLPGNLTMEVERQDAAQLVQALLPLVESVGLDHMERAIAAERAARPSSPALVVLLSLSRCQRGGDLPAELDDVLADALDLHTNAGSGRELLSLVGPERRASLVQRIRLRPHNVSGWIYLDLLTPAAAGTMLVGALRGFNRACVPDVAAYVHQLVDHVYANSRRALQELASEHGPNAAMLKQALHEQP